LNLTSESSVNATETVTSLDQIQDLFDREIYSEACFHDFVKLVKLNKLNKLNMFLKPD